MEAARSAQIDDLNAQSVALNTSQNKQFEILATCEQGSAACLKAQSNIDVLQGQIDAISARIIALSTPDRCG